MAAVPLALILSACVPETDESAPDPTFSIDPSTPAPSATLPAGAGNEFQGKTSALSVSFTGSQKTGTNR